MKVLHVFSKLDRGGAELRTLDLLRYMDFVNKGIEIHICALSGERGALDQSFENLGIKIHYINLKKSTFIKEFMQVLKREKFDIIHSHIHYMSGLLLLFAGLNGIKGRIVHFRSTSLKKDIKYRFFIKLCKVLSTDLIYVSKSVERSIGIFSSKNKVIYNGFVIENVKGEAEVGSDFKYEIVQIGRLNDAKNYEFSIEVISRLKQTYPNIKFHIFGKVDSEDLFNKLKSKIKKRDLERNIIFEGVTEEVGNVMANSKVMLFPSKREGLPGTLIEAGINNLQTVASTIEPNLEVSEIFKVISTVELDIDIWVKRIIEIIEESTDIQTFLNESYKPFNIEKTCEAVLEVYNKYK